MVGVVAKMLRCSFGRFAWRVGRLWFPPGARSCGLLLMLLAGFLVRSVCKEQHTELKGWTGTRLTYATLIRDRERESYKKLRKKNSMYWMKSWSSHLSEPSCCWSRVYTSWSCGAFSRRWGRCSAWGCRLALCSGRRSWSTSPSRTDRL